MRSCVKYPKNVWRLDRSSMMTFRNRCVSGQMGSNQNYFSFENYVANAKKMLKLDSKLELFESVFRKVYKSNEINGGDKRASACIPNRIKTETHSTHVTNIRNSKHTEILTHIRRNTHKHIQAHRHGRTFRITSIDNIPLMIITLSEKQTKRRRLFLDPLNYFN